MHSTSASSDWPQVAYPRALPPRRCGVNPPQRLLLPTIPLLRPRRSGSKTYEITLWWTSPPAAKLASRPIRHSPNHKSLAEKRSKPTPWT